MQVSMRQNLIGIHLGNIQILRNKSLMLKSKTEFKSQSLKISAGVSRLTFNWAVIILLEWINNYCWWLNLRVPKKNWVGLDIENITAKIILSRKSTHTYMEMFRRWQFLMGKYGQNNQVSSTGSSKIHLKRLKISVDLVN